MNKNSMQTVGDILVKFNPFKDKYISREFQAFGCYMTDELSDPKHKSLYMRLAKTLPRAILERALSYVKDADIKGKNKGALFMWKLKELGAWERKIKDQRSKIKSKRKKDIPF